MPEDFSKLTDKELNHVLHTSPIATGGSARAGAAIGEMMSRLGVKITQLNAGIDRVNESSTRLVSETNGPRRQGSAAPRKPARP